jgi:hypothetical protein
MANRRDPAAKAPLSKVQQARVVRATIAPTARLLWVAAPRAVVGVVVVMGAQALIPAAIAYVGKHIVDAVALAQRGDVAAAGVVGRFVALECGLVVLQTALARGQGVLREAIAARLKRALAARVIDKALHLELRHFEDAAVYDKMQNARREADRRPLNLVMQALGIAQNVVTLASYAVLLIAVAPWALPVLFAATLPGFLSELRFAGETFRVLTWRAPEGRRLNYLEWLLTRDASVKEVKLFGLGPLVLGRFTALYDRIVGEDLQLGRRRAAWGLAFSPPARSTRATSSSRSAPRPAPSPSATSRLRCSPSARARGRSPPCCRPSVASPKTRCSCPIFSSSSTSTPPASARGVRRRRSVTPNPLCSTACPSPTRGAPTNASCAMSRSRSRRAKRSRSSARTVLARARS